MPDTARNLPNPAAIHRGRDTITPDHGVDDAYRQKGSLPDHTCCRVCGAIVERGRWVWPDQATSGKLALNETTCPACRRIADNYPAGWLEARGPFVVANREDIRAIVRAEETAERDEHPLARVMAIEEAGDSLRITTTDIHLPRRIAAALARAHGGDVDIQYADDDERVAVTWHPAGAAVARSAGPAGLPPFEVKANGLIVTPEADAYVRERVARLTHFHNRVMGVKVVLDAPEAHHRKGGPYRVQVHVAVPGASADVTNQEASDLHVAIRSAFDAAQRQLQDLLGRMRDASREGASRT